MSHLFKDPQSQTLGARLGPAPLSFLYITLTQLLGFCFLLSLFSVPELLTGAGWQEAQGPAAKASLTSLCWLIKQDRRGVMPAWKFLPVIVLRVGLANEWGLITAKPLKYLLLPQSGDSSASSASWKEAQSSRQDLVWRGRDIFSSLVALKPHLPCLEVEGDSTCNQSHLLHKSWTFRPGCSKLESSQKSLRVHWEASRVYLLLARSSLHFQCLSLQVRLTCSSNPSYLEKYSVM